MKRIRNKYFIIISIISLVIMLTIVIQYSSNDRRYIKNFLNQYGWSGNIESANLLKWCNIFEENLHSELSQINAAQNSLDLPPMNFVNPSSDILLYRVNALVWKNNYLPDDGYSDYAIFVFFQTKTKEVLSAFLYETTYMNGNVSISIYPITVDQTIILNFFNKRIGHIP